MAVYLTEVVTDLAMPPQQRPIPHQFAMGDNNAYTITALLCDSRNPEAELLDGTVGGELVRPDGVTVALAGEKGDAVRQVNLAAGGLCNATPCSVTLPQACFAVPGRVTLTIKLTDGTTITQALSVSAVVVRTSTDEAVDPGEVIPDLAAIQAAASEAAEAAEDATAAAADARAAASSAASLIPDGTAFSKAVQGGTTYDVQDARTETVMDVLSLVDYGLGIERELSALPGTSLSTASVSFDNGVFLLTGHLKKSATTAKVFVDYGRRLVTGGTSMPSGSVQGVTLADGHTYRVRMEHISGSYSGDNTYVSPVFLKPGSITAQGTDGVLVYDASTYDHGIFVGVSIGRNNDSDGITFSEDGYKFRLIVEDITDIGDKNIAPIDTPTATSTHNPDDLLTVGGQLYKATQAIATGETIAAGTNVVETTVAAQLAALQNPPGYVHMSDLSAYGTDGVFTPDGDNDLVITLTVPYNGDTRNQIYTCIAKYERADGVTVWPTVVFRYGNTLNRTTAYTIGGNGHFQTQQWRVIRYPGVTTALTVLITIPVGVTVTIKDFYNEYSDAVSRTPYGIRINGHRQYLPSLMNPDTMPGVMMAVKSGACSMIQIPKRLSDGTWIFYHDDSLIYNDTYIRQADGTQLPATYNGTLWQNIDFATANSWDWGVSKGSMFAGTKPMTMEQFFTVCGKTGIMPMLSIHPWPSASELEEIKAIARQCGVLARLGIKCTVSHVADAYAVFGNDVESYTVDVSAEPQSASDINAAISAMNGLTGCTVRRVIELFASTAYNAYFGESPYDPFKLIADAGYGCALAQRTGTYHPTLPNNNSAIMKASDFEFWRGKGVSEYTYEYDWSNGLNW